MSLVKGRRHSLVTRGQFTVTAQESPDSIFDTLVGTLGELGAKLDDIDTLKHRVSGKSKTSAMRWGTKFHARVVRVSFNVKVETYDFSFLPDDRFVKELHKTFKQYLPCSDLQVDYPKQVDKLTEANEEEWEHVPSGQEDPIAGSDAYSKSVAGTGGAPFIPAAKNAAVNTDYKILSTDTRQCAHCGASNLQGNPFCGKCGKRFAGCPECGYLPEEESAFCIKCGTKLA